VKKSRPQDVIINPVILNIETATTACSVCIARGEEILALKELNNGYSHSENLHPFIEETLRIAGLKPGDLDAVAVSRGPGSYTGLRIGVSTAKGLCYGLNIPLIGINTLKNMAAGVIKDKADDSILYCAMLDARRMEVYCAVFDSLLKEIVPTTAKIINEESAEEFSFERKIIFFGDGAEKCKTIINAIDGAEIISGIFPSALQMVTLSVAAFHSGQLENVAYFEPHYLKEFFSTQKE
jgi:tRNA threonylcarbamoyladenosine biosynthesis protein TsaB